MRPAQTALVVWFSLLLTLGMGLPLALLLTLDRAGSLDSGLALADVAALHGAVQLWGFTFLFVLGMGLRLLGIFARGLLPWPWLPFLVIAFVGIALGVRFAALLSGTEEAQEQARLIAALLLLGSTVLFLALVLALLRSPRLRSRQTVISFAAGTGLLVLGAALEVIGALRDNRGFYESAAISLAVLGGFAVAFIAGVASRSMRKHAWPEGPFMVAFAVILASACLMLTYTNDADASVLAVRAASALLLGVGTLWLAVVVAAGAFSRAADRPGVASKPHLLLVRSAFAWLILAGGILAVTGADGAIRGDLPSEGVVDAVRHALGIGVVANLILGMSLLLLPGFSKVQLSNPLQRSVALALLLLVNSTAALRTGSTLVQSPENAQMRALLQAGAGSALEMAFIIFCVALFVATRRPATA